MSEPDGSFLTQGQAIQIKTGCTIDYTLPAPTPMIFIVRAGKFDRHQILAEAQQITPEGQVENYLDQFGNRVWRLVAPPGPLRVHYDARIAVSSEPDVTLPQLQQTPVEHLPYDVLPYTWPSRYGDSDLFLDDAWRLFGNTPPGWPRVQAVCDWVHEQIAYGAGSTTSTSGRQAYEQRRGVCRDFAHIALSFCRALNIPARYVCGYLPDIGVPPDPTPMDFHAWFEAYLDGAWYTFDARHNIPRIGRVVIGRGRDAVDVALTTSYGSAELNRLHVWAEQAEAGAEAA
jgi:transglutaminase-like putative cysteine protease